LEGVGLMLASFPLSSELIGAKVPNSNFWGNKRVYVTGHTGFKGGWLALWLSMLGAKVTGFALPPNNGPNFFSAVRLERHLARSYLANVNDYDTLKAEIIGADPEIILHLAAQPLVRRSYAEPLETYKTNVMGTVNLLQAARNCENLQAIVVVTSDKCYENKAWCWGYRETDTLGGHDPYSSSKACQELVVTAFRHSYLQSSGVGIATARAGNVIGGGDWAEDRLIPDAMRAYFQKTGLIVRNPHATRPWQHVLEPLAGYLMLSEKIFSEPDIAGSWNFGPRDSDVRTVEEVLKLMSQRLSNGLSWRVESSSQHQEAQLLKLDSSRSTTLLDWTPKWKLEQALTLTCDWYRAFSTEPSMETISESQIVNYSGV
jgi:CDP-glucose 4,6-dehydratase